ncbi:DUF2637 domain-containing protein [Pseudonocardia sp. H11422]|uniref:DUF2637 domain-containing protein n=1 Tax=Pseudonocardia sp. H11422 TaxID=2835866 RepID=UPI001BDCC577|nr:DUF2637 domain-containing protein [Pseudonocardia sp. H11422]
MRFGKRRHEARPAALAAGVEVAQPRARWDWQKFVGGSRGVLLGVVVFAPELAAWQGLLALGRDTFKMSGGWEYLVPLLFGAAAFYVALLAQRYVLRGDSALTERMLTWMYAAAGAGFNWWHAHHVGEHAAALFFGGASLSAALLWDRTLRAWRRDQLREVGALERPLPRFRALRWMLAPVSTFQAFRASVLLGLTTPDEALAAVERQQAAVEQQRVEAERAKREQAEIERGPAEIEQPPAAELEQVRATEIEDEVTAEAATEPQGFPVVPDEQRRTSLVELAARSKAQAVREAWRMNGVDGNPSLDDIRPAVRLLAEHGVEVTEKYVREVRLRDQRSPQSSRPVLTAVVGA